jgi:hypothetical protein
MERGRPRRVEPQDGCYDRRDDEHDSEETPGRRAVEPGCHRTEIGEHALGIGQVGEHQDRRKEPNGRTQGAQLGPCR